MRRKRKQQQEMTFLEAVETMRRIVDALNQDDHLTVFRLVGITDEVAANIDSAQELYEIATVRVANIAKLARMETP